MNGSISHSNQQLYGEIEEVEREVVVTNDHEFQGFGSCLKGL
ncbi:hypothetical protein [Candidatus Thiodiazotropha sp. LNASS1]